MRILLCQVSGANTYRPGVDKSGIAIQGEKKSSFKITNLDKYPEDKEFILSAVLDLLRNRSFGPVADVMLATNDMKKVETFVKDIYNKLPDSSKYNDKESQKIIKDYLKIALVLLDNKKDIDLGKFQTQDQERYSKNNAAKNSLVSKETYLTNADLIYVKTQLGVGRNKYENASLNDLIARSTSFNNIDKNVGTYNIDKVSGVRSKNSYVNGEKAVISHEQAIKPSEKLTVPVPRSKNLNLNVVNFGGNDAIITNKVNAREELINKWESDGTIDAMRTNSNFSFGSKILVTLNMTNDYDPENSLAKKRGTALLKFLEDTVDEICKRNPDLKTRQEQLKNSIKLLKNDKNNKDEIKEDSIVERRTCSNKNFVRAIEKFKNTKIKDDTNPNKTRSFNKQEKQKIDEIIQTYENATKDLQETDKTDKVKYLGAYDVAKRELIKIHPNFEKLYTIDAIERDYEATSTNTDEYSESYRGWRMAYALDGNFSGIDKDNIITTSNRYVDSYYYEDDVFNPVFEEIVSYINHGDIEKARVLYDELVALTYKAIQTEVNEGTDADSYRAITKRMTPALDHLYNIFNNKGLESYKFSRIALDIGGTSKDIYDDKEITREYSFNLKPPAPVDELNASMIIDEKCVREKGCQGVLIPLIDRNGDPVTINTTGWTKTNIAVSKERYDVYRRYYNLSGNPVNEKSTEAIGFLEYVPSRNNELTFTLEKAIKHNGTELETIMLNNIPIVSKAGYPYGVKCKVKVKDDSPDKPSIWDVPKSVSSNGELTGKWYVNFGADGAGKFEILATVNGNEETISLIKTKTGYSSKIKIKNIEYGDIVFNEKDGTFKFTKNPSYGGDEKVKLQLKASDSDNLEKMEESDTVEFKICNWYRVEEHRGKNEAGVQPRIGGKDSNSIGVDVFVSLSGDYLISRKYRGFSVEFFGSADYRKQNVQVQRDGKAQATIDIADGSSVSTSVPVGTPMPGTTSPGTTSFTIDDLPALPTGYSYTAEPSSVAKVSGDGKTVTVELPRNGLLSNIYVKVTKDSSVQDNLVQDTLVTVSLNRNPGLGGNPVDTYTITNVSKNNVTIGTSVDVSTMIDDIKEDYELSLGVGLRYTTDKLVMWDILFLYATVFGGVKFDALWEKYREASDLDKKTFTLKDVMQVAGTIGLKINENDLIRLTLGFTSNYNPDNLARKDHGQAISATLESIHNFRVKGKQVMLKALVEGKKQVGDNWKSPDNNVNTLRAFLDVEYKISKEAYFNLGVETSKIYNDPYEKSTISPSLGLKYREENTTLSGRVILDIINKEGSGGKKAYRGRLEFKGEKMVDFTE